MESWDSLAESWDTTDGTQHYAQRAFAKLTPYLTSGRGAVILDFGCGTGLLTAKLRKVAQRVVAVDMSDPMVKKVREKFPEIESHAGDIRDLVPDLRSTFDVIVASSVLKFVEKLPETLEALAACLKPGGRLFQFDWYNAEDTDVEKGFNRKIAEKIHHEAGLQIVETEILDFENPVLPGPVFFAVLQKAQI